MASSSGGTHKQGTAAALSDERRGGLLGPCQLYLSGSWLMQRTERRKKQEKEWGFYVNRLTKAAVITVNLGEVNSACCPHGPRQCFVNYILVPHAHLRPPNGYSHGQKSKWDQRQTINIHAGFRKPSVLIIALQNHAAAPHTPTSELDMTKGPDESQ
ncbi:hypothetical protein BKA81DRAFT_401487 [Phyllosticta paracitricarpa]